MKRRNFTQSVLASVGVMSLPVGVSLAAQFNVDDLKNSKQLTSKEGLKLKLKQHIYPTKNKDSKQFILTYDVKNRTETLSERIYELTTATGQVQQLYMTPINSNQLQAVINWRLNA